MANDGGACLDNCYSIFREPLAFESFGTTADTFMILIAATPPFSVFLAHCQFFFLLVSEMWSEFRGTSQRKAIIRELESR
jgi:hypothetical protein